MKDFAKLVSQSYKKVLFLPALRDACSRERVFGRRYLSRWAWIRTTLWFSYPQLVVFYLTESWGRFEGSAKAAAAPKRKTYFSPSNRIRHH
jgi:hypothetical protein